MYIPYLPSMFKHLKSLPYLSLSPFLNLLISLKTADCESVSTQISMFAQASLTINWVEYGRSIYLVYIPY